MAVNDKIQTRKPLYRLERERRVVTARAFEGKVCNVDHRPFRADATAAETHYRAVVVAVAYMPHGTTSEVLVLHLEDQGWLALPLSQVGMISEVGP